MTDNGDTANRPPDCMIGSSRTRRIGRTIDVDLKEVAAASRKLLLAIALNAVCVIVIFALGVIQPIHILSSMAMGIVLILSIVCYVVVFACWLWLMLGLKTHVIGLLFLSVVALIPVLNLIMWGVALLAADSTLRQYGVRGGILAASPERVAYVMNTPHCETCGYNLTGNISGRCPECGQALSDCPPTA